MGKKEQILELIKENDGLTYTTLIRKYNEKYDINPDNPDTLKEKSGYSYLKRLKKDGLIENDKGTNVLYKPTSKAFSDKPNDLEYLKSLFEKEKVEIIGSKLTKDDFERLELI